MTPLFIKVSGKAIVSRTSLATALIQNDDRWVTVTVCVLIDAELLKNTRVLQ